MEISCSRNFVSIGVNPTSQCADWGDELVCFGGGSCVCVYDPSLVRLVATLPGHSGRVNSTKWMKRDSLIVSGGQDGSIRWWQWEKGESKIIREGSSGKDDVIALSVAREDLFASVDSQGECALWSVKDDLQVENTLTLRTGKLLTCVSFTPFSRIGAKSAKSDGQTADEFLLSVASVDFVIHCWKITVHPDGKTGSKFLSLLVGHRDWVNCMCGVMLYPSEVAECESIDAPPLDIRTSILSSKKDSGEEDDEGDMEILYEEVQPKESDENMIDEEGCCILLASASNDQTIRLWRVGSNGRTTLDALLNAHEDWVSGVQWHRISASDDDPGRLYLQSSSHDRSMRVWATLEGMHHVWSDVVTVGEFAGLEGPVGTLLSYYGCIGHAGKQPNVELCIMCHALNGSWTLFEVQRNVVDVGEEGGRRTKFHAEPMPTISGHNGAVVAFSWIPNSFDFFTAGSRDMCVRRFSLKTKMDGDCDCGDFDWMEKERPQIHGYEMTGLDVFENGSFVSWSEEKAIRIFEKIDGKYAELSELGLSNKVLCDDTTLSASSSDLMEESSQKDEEGEERKEKKETVSSGIGIGAAKRHIHDPPVESDLIQRTLWPETHKLFGHGNEVACAVISHGNTLIASSAKTYMKRYAGIILHEWSEEKKQWVRRPGCLESSDLTVNALRFSESDDMLLAVSRDRSFSIFKISGKSETQVPYCVLVHVSDAHKRDIWCCDWVPSRFAMKSKVGEDHEKQTSLNIRHTLFATGSRDRRLVLWRMGDDGDVGIGAHAEDEVLFPSGVRSIEFCPDRDDGLCCVGLATGALIFLTLKSTEHGSLKWNIVKQIPNKMSHVSFVNQISWKPCNRVGGKTEQYLVGSCSDDGSCCVYSIKIPSS